MRKPVTRKLLAALCLCENAFLDAKYGKGMRVMNWGRSPAQYYAWGYYCTTCGVPAAKDVHRKPTTKELL